MERLSEEMLDTIEHVTRGGLGATVHSTRAMVAEIRVHRDTMKRLEEWAVEMSEWDIGGCLINSESVIRELRKRMKGVV